MGNNQTKKYIERKTKINHPKFESSNAQLYYCDEIGCDLIAVTFPIQHEKVFSDWEANMKKVVNINDESFMFCKKYQYIKKSLCGSCGVIKIEYDNYPYVLLDEIDNRRIVDKKFLQTQLWYLLFVLVWTHTEFNNFQKKLGDVQPQNLFVNQMGQVKVLCRYSWPNQTTNFEKTLFNNQPTYLAPQQLLQCKLARTNPSSDPSIAQSFSIGLTLLESITLLKMQSLYNRINYLFNIQLLQNIIKGLPNLTYFSSQSNCNKKYSKQLINAIVAMCQIDPKNRMKPTQCYNWLKPYQVDILNLKQTNIPSYNQRKNQHMKNKPQQKLSKPPSYKQFNSTPPTTQIKDMSPTPVRLYQPFINPICGYAPVYQQRPMRYTQQHVPQIRISNNVKNLCHKYNSLQKQHININNSPNKSVNNEIPFHQHPSVGSIKKNVEIHQHIINNHFIPTYRHQPPIGNINPVNQLNTYNNRNRFIRYQNDTKTVKEDQPLKSTKSTSNTAMNQLTKNSQQQKIHIKQYHYQQKIDMMKTIDKDFYQKNIGIGFDRIQSQMVELNTPYINAKKDLIKEVDLKLAKSRKMFPSY